ncbi:MAG: hypothetical protein LAO09_12145 [Acidobacteriia bacterium]|nr:hypothetical protein [Terriglobia bacterium]
MKAVLVTTIILLISTLTAAIDLPSQQGQATLPSQTTARPSDVKSLDAIMLAVYDVISGPAGERDWGRLRSVFTPDARFIPTTRKPDGTFTYEVWTVDGLIEKAKERFKEHAFYEREVSRKVESFGCVTQVFSTYESRETPDGKPIERGINSIQLFNDGSRWWVLSIYWDRERPDNLIPARYLNKKR